MVKREHLVFALLIVVITFGVYYDSFNNSFVYDDYPFLVDNPAVKTLTTRGVLANFTEWHNISACDKLAKDVWRPLVTTSFALDHRLWKLDSRPYHIENTVLHILNALLVYVCAVLIIGSPFAAFITAIVFAIHPAQTEAVSWVSGRANVLFLLFFLLAFIAHIRIRTRGDRGAGYSILAIFFTLSLLSKEMAIVLPLICILYDMHFTSGGDLRRYARYYAPLFLISAFYVLARYSVLGSIAQKGEFWGGSLFASIPVMAEAVAGYVAVAFFPVNLRVEHVINPVTASSMAHVFRSALILGAVAAAYAVLRRKKKISFFILWFFAALLPVCNIVPLKAVMAERFLYLPIIGFAALFGMLFAYFDRMEGRRVVKPVAVMAMTLAIVFYGVASIGRNTEWRDEMSFYMKEAIRSPASPKAHYNLGYICEKEALKNAGDRELAAMYYAMAVSEYAKTVSLKPDSRIAYMGLGNTLNSAGMYDMAAVNFRKALAFGKDADAYNNLGVAYYRGGKLREAEEAFREALRLDPNNQNALVNMGNCYYQKGEFASAARSWRLAARLGVKTAYLAGRLDEMKSKGF